MLDDFNTQAAEWHEALPGIVRAFLTDHGLSDEVTNEYLLGWDGESITVPIRNSRSDVVFFETWHPDAIGVPILRKETVELFARNILDEGTEQIVIAEGVFEALLFQSAGVAAVSATGSGRFFKTRDWAEYFQDIPNVLVAFKKGPKPERRKEMLDRDGVAVKILLALPQATRVNWPAELSSSAGAFEFFVQGRGTKEELEVLWAEA